ncbi:MAG: hypothetical protein JWM14_1902 [Chitinophagaceae bacterium]|nr:hypothetical protein [Chitinophagaceae bacterium]
MKKIISIFLAALLIASCRNKEQLGPDLVGIYGPVTITQPLAVNMPSVNFSTGEKIFFTAKFENSAVWTITITGSNGAQKIITGISKEINAENSTWTGTADVLPSFIAGSVNAVLTFNNDPQTDNVPITITAKRISDYPTDVLVSDFVVNKQHCYCAGTIPPSEWPSDFPATINTETTNGLPDGNSYLVMGPQAPWQGGGSPYVDILIISPRNSMINYGTYYPLYADPSKVYFNIMVYNTGTPTWLQVTLFEEGTAARHIDIKPNWTGWKQVSVKYSDLVANSTAFASNIQPTKVTAIQLVLLSNIPTSNPALTTTQVKTAFDHITFTHNAPYQP